MNTLAYAQVYLLKICPILLNSLNLAVFTLATFLTGNLGTYGAINKNLQKL